MSKQKIKQNTDQRSFVMVYHDFLKSELLDNHYQIIIYIFLKMFANSNNQCFPSAKKLSQLTKIGITKVKATLNELEEKNIITKENRIRSDGGKSSNLYTIHDFKELWTAGSNEEVAMVIEKYEDSKLISILESKGYMVIKEKGPTSAPTKVTDVSTQLNCLKQFDNTTPVPKSQELERYTLKEIKELFGYDTMLYDNPDEQEHIDSIMDILYTTMNTNKTTIRIAGTDKPTMVVIGKLMKLNNESIMYAIKKFKEQTERIKNPTAYMLTILYMAPEQYKLDITNQVQHDFF